MASPWTRGETLSALIEASTREAPDAVAVTYQGASATYAAIDGRANTLANHLRSLGVGPEVRVALMLRRSIELVVAIIGVLKAGGVYVPLDERSPPARSRTMQEQARASVLLTTDCVADELIGSTVRQIVRIDPEHTQVWAGSPDAVAGLATRDNLAYITYTSGSSGTPNAVGTPHGPAVLYLRWLSASGCLRQDDVTLQLAPLTFDASIRDILGPLSVGARVVLVPDADIADPSAIRAVIEDERVTCLPSLVPATLRTLAAGSGERHRVRRVLVSGEELHAATVHQARRWLGPAAEVINHYGPTECVMTSTFHWVGPDPGESVAIGRERHGVVVHVLDHALRHVPQGQIGEAYIAGCGVTRGYLNDPGLTARRFVPDPFSSRPGGRMYRTGDLVARTADGTLVFHGRVDDQIKIHGVRVEPGEVEASLLRHEAIHEAAVTAPVINDGRRQLVAYVVFADHVQCSTDELRTFLRERLPDHLVPNVVVPMSALPRTLHGKVARRELPAPTAGATSAAGPASPVEHALVDMCRDLTGIREVSVDDDFFELGGDSLLAMRLLSRIRQRWRVDVDFATVVRNPTIRRMAAALTEARGRRSTDDAGLTRVDRGRAWPLSFAQQRLWFFERLAPHSPQNTIPTAFRVVGGLDVGALERAVMAVVGAHGALRTAFGVVDGVPVQRVVGWGELGASCVEVVDGAVGSGGVGQALREWGRRPFVLGAAPLVRVMVVREGVGRWVVLVCVHHLVADGWSLGVMFEDLGTAYRAVRAGRAVEVEAPPVGYVDYAVWQRRWLAGRRLKELLAFWRAELEGAPARLELPTDRPRPAVQRYEGAVVRRVVPASLVAAAGQLARAEQATTFMVLLAGWAAVLCRYSGQDEVVVGVPVAGRTRVELERVVGLFVNTVPVRISAVRTLAFRGLVGRTRDAALRAFARADLPFERLVEALQPDRSLAHAPVFQVLADLQHLTVPDLGADVQVTPVHVDTGTSKFDVSLSFEQRGDRVDAVVTYDTALFDRATIERMLEHFHTLAAHALDAPDVQVGRLRLSGVEERRRLVAAPAAGAGAQASGCVHDLVVAQAERRPDACAVRAHDGQLTYAQLLDRSGRLAARLRALRVVADDLVGVCVDRGHGLVVGLLGILRAGGAYVPLDPDYPAARLRFLIADSGVSVIVTQPHLVSRLAPLLPAGVTTIAVDSDHPDDPVASVPALVTGPHNLAYLIYTSGSTGTPKGVPITHHNLTRLFAVTQRWFDFGHADVWTLFHSLAFDFSAWEIWGALAHGGRLVVVPWTTSRSPDAFLRLLRDEAVTVLNQTPSVLGALTACGAMATAALPALRHVILGGEAVEQRVLDDWFGRFGDGRPRLVNMYGTTETTVHATYQPLHAGMTLRHGASSIGQGLPDLSAHVLDEELEPVPYGVAGELFIGGAGLARGYHRRPDLTAQRFVPDPHHPTPGQRLYRTGDRVRRRPDGTLEYLGRTDHQIKLRGFRIEPGEVEAALTSHPDVHQALVTTRRVGPGDVRLVAYVTPERVRTNDLRAHLGERLPKHMVPSETVALDAFPLTPNGKIDRARLPEPTLRAPSATHPEPPASATERRVAQVVRAALGVDELGRHDDFFDLGGHSLLAAKVIADLRQRFTSDVQMRTLFAHPTVAGLAAAIDAGASAAHQPRVRTVPTPRLAGHDGAPLLVTGGTGMVGSFIVDELRRRGVIVRLLARAPSSDRARAVADEVIVGDLDDSDSLRRAVAGVAGIVHVATTFTEPVVDVKAMHTLLEGWGTGPFVFISSVDVYGIPRMTSVDESHPLDAHASPYAWGKIQCETALIAHARERGRADFAILRPPYVWGPHPYCRYQLRLAAAPFFEAVDDVVVVAPPGPGDAPGHAWIDARDLALAVVGCLDRPLGAACNAIGATFSWHDLFRELAALTDTPVRIRRGQPTSSYYGVVRSYSGHRLDEHLGFTPRREWQLTLRELFGQGQ